MGAVLVEFARSAVSLAYKLIPGKLGIHIRAARQLRAYRKQHPRVGQRGPHGLPGELIVSLTSYPPRFPTLHYTLLSLLEQTVRPDRIVLFIAEGDKDKLAAETRALIGRGIDLRIVPDLKSFKKLIFAVQEWPDAFIVTTDDDIFYAPDWLEQLVEGFDPGRPTIVCHRAHRIPPFEGASPPTYLTWNWDVQDEAAREPSHDLVAVGVGGTLYPPGSLHPDVTDQAAFLRLCPHADDLWFYWCARRHGTLYRKVGGAFPLLYWDSSQNERLFDSNTTANDEQVRNLVAEYGNPNS